MLDFLQGTCDSGTIRGIGVLLENKVIPVQREQMVPLSAEVSMMWTHL